MTTLDVLLIESRPGAGALAATDLEAAGHRVHRCHDPADPTFPCAALRDPGSCPLDAGVDLALLVRPSVAATPGPTENGATCAIRAGLPIVEQGSEVLDPFAPWVTHRVRQDGDVAEACEDALDIADEPLERHIRQRIAGLLQRAGLDEDDATVRLVHVERGLEVHLDIPLPADARRDHALTVRALDAVRSSGSRKVAQTRISVHHPVAS